MRTNDANTDARLLEAFGALLLVKDYKHILINDILTVSGVSRQSFYRRYSSKYDLAADYVFSLLLALETLIGEDSTIKEANCMVLTIIKNHPVEFTHLYSSEEGSTVTSAATTKLLQKWRKKPSPTWATTLIHTRILTDWIQGRFKKPMEEVYDEITRTMPAYELLSEKELAIQVEKYNNRKARSPRDF